MNMTEARNPKTTHIDRMPVSDMVAIINEENEYAARAVTRAQADVTRAAEAAAAAIGAGHRMFYVGAGTSGRLGVVDASECPPTFGVSPDLVVGVIAGGRDAMFRAVEGMEDSREAGARAMEEYGVSAGDLVVGISAAGGAKFVLGAVEEARRRGAVTVGLTSNPGVALLSAVDIPVCVETGAEVVTGSTRMKAGTAQKLVLNTLSTCAMIATGKVYENMMINLRPSNEKLRLRMIRITCEITGTDDANAARLLGAGGWDIRTAVRLYEEEKKHETM